MPSPSVTYTFSNSTTADATQVNQNFTDIINGITDGTKDLSVSALTCAGNLSVQGNSTIGNASSDTLTVTASLASSIPIGTTNSYDIGSATVGLRSVYLASDDSAAKSVRLLGSTIGTSYTFTFPTSGGTSRYRLETNGSGVTSWQPVYRSPMDSQNYSIAASVGSNALTITLNGANGSAPSSTNPVDIVFRNATAATGTPSEVSLTSGAITLVISSGSTLGHTSGNAHYIFVYAINNAGTIELAASSKLYDEGSIVSTTAEGGAGAADSATAIYSTTARSNVALKLIGRMKTTQATAGTWATTMSEITLGDINCLRPQNIELFFTTGNGYGSDASCKVRRFSTVSINTGNITYTDSSTNGLSITILTPGLYLLTSMDADSVDGITHGFGLNASTTTAVTSLVPGTSIVPIIGHIGSGDVGQGHTISTTYRLNQGDVLTPHREGKGGGPTTAAYLSQFGARWIGW